MGVMRPNYNSTKLCFAYFGFSPASDLRKNAWFILYRGSAERQAEIARSGPPTFALETL
jgi:hypothetical protein